MSADVNDVITAGRLAEEILRTWEGGCPPELPESVQQLTHDAVRLAQLHMEIVGGWWQEALDDAREREIVRNKLASIGTSEN